VRAIKNQKQYQSRCGGEIILVMRGSPESMLGRCYIIGVKYGGGVNIQYEDPHPDNHPMPGHQKPGLFNPGPIIGKKIGVRARVIPTGGKDVLTCDLDLGGFKPFHKTSSTQWYGKCNGEGSEKTIVRMDQVDKQDGMKFVTFDHVRSYSKSL
jgi:hypothetical protein